MRLPHLRHSWRTDYREAACDHWPDVYCNPLVYPPIPPAIRHCTGYEHSHWHPGGEHCGITEYQRCCDCQERRVTTTWRLNPNRQRSNATRWVEDGALPK